MESAQAKALHEAVKALYFADSADYGTALWKVVEHIDPEMVELLEVDGDEAYELTKRRASGEAQ